MLLQRAVSSYSRALQLVPDYTDALLCRGRAWFALGCTLQAAEDFRRCAALLSQGGKEGGAVLREALVAAADVFRISFWAGVSASALEGEDEPVAPGLLLHLSPVPIGEPLLVHSLPAARAAAISGGSIANSPTNPLHSIYCVHWLDASTCDALVTAIEAHADAASGSEDGWSTARHAHFATTDIELSRVPALRRWLAPQLVHALLPCLTERFDVPSERLRVHEVFAVKYEATTQAASGATRLPQAALEAHRDGPLLSFNVLLSDPATFEGGGTRFETLDMTLRPRNAGDLVLHCGHMLHSAAPVTRGVRYIIVGFVDAIRPPCSIDSAAPAAPEVDVAVAAAATAAAAENARRYNWVRAPPALTVEDADYAVLRSDWCALRQDA